MIESMTRCNTTPTDSPEVAELASSDINADQEAIQRFIDGLPHLPGVYRMIGTQAEVLYVGKAKDLFKRVRSYFSSRQLGPRIQHMISRVHHIDVTITRSEAEALLLESTLIKTLNPRYNIIFRDDKSYSYLCFTGHDFPRIVYHRGTLKPPHRYFGPYPSSLAVKEGIEMLQKVFRLRNCEDSVFANRSRPCMLYQISRCSAPCVGHISEDMYQADVHTATQFLEGKGDHIVNDLRQTMERHAEQLDFEKAALYRDRIKLLQQLREKQFVHSTEAKHQQQHTDVFAIIYHQHVVAINWTAIRGGRHCGERTFFPTKDFLIDEEEADHLNEWLARFLIKHYEQHDFPHQLVLSLLTEEDVILLKEALLTLKSEKTKLPKMIIAPKNHHKAWLDMAIHNAKCAIEHKLKVDSTQQERLSVLQQSITGWEHVQRIECFDISHTQGEQTVASCVVFDEGYMQNKQYRRFNIEAIQGGDDYAAMRQVLTRRALRITAGDAQKPDAWLIDGGAGQCSIAKEVLIENDLTIHLMSISKGEGRTEGLEQLWYIDEHSGKPRSFSLESNNLGFHLLQHIRNEAHRFAIEGHRARRSKTHYESSLNDIPGVGAKRKKALLMHFGGLKQLSSVSVDEIATVPGISKQLAESIYQWLHT